VSLNHPKPGQQGRSGPSLEPRAPTGPPAGAATSPARGVARAGALGVDICDGWVQTGLGAL
jgi:hypothetical protein